MGRDIPLEQAAPSPAQPGFEHFQGSGSRSFSGQPLHPHREEFFPDIYSILTFFQWESILTCPITTCPCKKSQIPFISFQGAGISASSVLHGMVFKKETEGDVTSVKDAKIAVYSCPFDGMITETKVC